MFEITQDRLDTASAADVEFQAKGGGALGLGDTVATGDKLDIVAINGAAFEAGSGFTPEAVGCTLGGYSGGLYEKNNFLIVDDADKRARISIKDGSDGLTLELATLTPQPIFTFEQGDADNLSACGVTLYKDGSEVTVSSEFFPGDMLTAETDPGREFKEPETGKASIKFYGFVNGLTSEVFFDLDSPTEASLTLPDEVADELQCETDQVAVETIGDTYIYKVDQEQLQNLNFARFKVNTGNDEVFDYGQYMLSVLRIPYELPEGVILEPEQIKLATRDTGVTAPLLATDTLSFDLGTIEVSGDAGNMLDYVGTVAALHLPRVDAFNVDLSHVIGQTLGIEYRLNLYNGVATINVTSSKIGGDVVAQKQVDLGLWIPYAANLGAGGTNVESDGVEQGGDNGVLVPFVELQKKAVELPDGFFTVPITVEADLSAAAGYVEVENADLSFGCLGDEKRQIMDMLSGGVILK